MKLYTFRSYTPREVGTVETRWYSNDDVAYDHAAEIIKKYPATAEVEIWKASKPVEFLPVAVVKNKSVEGV